MNVSDKFKKQVAFRKNYIWKKQIGQNINFNKLDLGTYDLARSFDIAYERKGSKFRDTGLSYRINPGSGEREMFVAGSQGIVDWIFNFSNAISYGTEKAVGKELDLLWPKRLKRFGIYRPKLDAINRDRYRQQRGIARMAKKMNVQTMYGHSRGGALVADASFDGTKFGVDAAMILAKNIEMKNFRRKGLFDATLGLSGLENEIVESGHSFHWAYGN